MCIMCNLLFKKREEEQEYILIFDLICIEKLWQETQEANWEPKSSTPSLSLNYYITKFPFNAVILLQFHIVY